MRSVIVLYECRRPVLEQLFMLVVEVGRVDPTLIAQIRDRNFFHEVLPRDSNLLPSHKILGRVALSNRSPIPCATGSLPVLEFPVLSTFRSFMHGMPAPRYGKAGIEGCRAKLNVLGRRIGLW